MEIQIPEDVKQIKRWRCPACGADMTGRTYNLDADRKKCTKTWHIAAPVSRGYVAIADLPSIIAANT